VLKWIREFLLGAAVGFLLLLLVMLASLKAHADIISEIGGGYKLPSSEVMDARCHSVLIVDPLSDFAYDAQGRQKTVSCGGRALFIGWPIAWESANRNTRIGWFHLSHLASGPPFNHQNEVALNCLCATHTFHWGRRR
jgi:hypothetical protein